MGQEVLFVRTPCAAAKDVTTILQNLYLSGWHVVSHTESGGEYSFVLEPRQGYFALVK